MCKRIDKRTKRERESEYGAALHREQKTRKNKYGLRDESADTQRREDEGAEE